MPGLLLRLAYNLTVWPILMLAWLVRRRVRLRRAQPFSLRLRSAPRPQPGGPLRRRHAALADLGRLLDAAAANPRVTGLLLVLDGVDGRPVDFAELRSLLDRFKRSGKPLHVHLDHTDWHTLTAVAPADRLSTAPASNVTLHGLGLEILFFGDLLARHGVRAEVVQRGEYKGVMEPFVRREPTPALAESLQALVDSLYDEVAERLAGRPGWDAGRARAALDDGPYTLQHAVRQGVLDGAGQVSDAEATLLRAAAGRPAAEEPEPPAPAPTPPRALADLSRVGLLGPRPAALRREPLIACVPIAGLILDRPMGGFSRRSVAVAARIAPRLRALADNPRVAVIVLVIDSRGGTVSGSDRIWDAARHAAGRKPLVAWMRSYAASGGYYVAAPARAIVASPFTITGSIGVIASKPNVADATARLGIHAVRIGRGEHVNPLSPFRSFDETERAWMHARVDELYERFLQVVAEGRRMTRDEVDAVARGRVWSGAQAHGRGLVDRLGHHDEVMDLARELAGLQRGSGRVVWISPPEGLLQRLRRLAGPGSTGPGLDALIDPALETAWLAAESPFLAYAPPIDWS